MTTVLGVGGSLDDFRLRLPTRVTDGDSLVIDTSSNISRSTRPLYLNLVPHEKKPPPETTLGTSELEGNLKEINNLKMY